MNDQVRAVLERLYLDDDRQRTENLPVDQRTRNLSRVSGEYLSIFARAMQAKKIVEIGSSNGVSTIWFAIAMEVTGGFVTGTEIIESRAADANANLADAGLTAFARVAPGDARATIQSMGTDIDIAFIDAEKDDYVSHFNAIWPHIRVGGVAIADNVTSHDCSDFQAMVRGRDDCDTVTVTLDRGLEVTIRTR